MIRFMKNVTVLSFYPLKRRETKIKQPIMLREERKTRILNSIFRFRTNFFIATIFYTLNYTQLWSKTYYKLNSFVFIAIRKFEWRLKYKLVKYKITSQWICTLIYNNTTKKLILGWLLVVDKNKKKWKVINNMWFEHYSKDDKVERHLPI